MNRLIKYLLVLLSVIPLSGNAKELPPIGVTSSGGYYAFDSSVTCAEEGADRILSMGSRIIKLWLSDQSMRVNPYHTDWNRASIHNCIDVLESESYRAVLSKDFSTIVLVTHTFDTRQPDANVDWWDGMDAVEISRVEQEMYEVASYLMTKYRGSGKVFILQNWEGDNMIGSNGWRYDTAADRFYRPGHEATAEQDDRAYRLRERGLTEWFNARQCGVDRAVEALKNCTDVIVRHALEVNFTYLDPSDAPYPYPDSPILLRRIVPYTDCDLYSYSCWSAGVLSRAWTMKKRLRLVLNGIGETYTDAGSGEIKPRRPLGRRQRSRIMVGEYGGPERYQASDTGSWAAELTPQTDRMQRKVIQVQTEAALEAGAECVIFWEIYCNVPRVDTDSAVVIDSRNGEQAVSNDQMQGSWLVRTDGTFTEGYLYLRGLLGSRDIWLRNTCRSGKRYAFDGASGCVEVNMTVQGYPPYLSPEAADSICRRIRIEGSADGKHYTPVAADAFVSLYGEASQQLVVLNRDPLPETWRFVRTIFDADVFADPQIKIYKPNEQRLTKR